MSGLRIGFIVYGSPDQVSGGYRYDRELAQALETRGHQVVFRTPAELAPLETLPDRYDLLLLDELCHPSLYRSVGRIPVPSVAVVHHLACDEDLPPLRRLRHRRMERRFLSAVDSRISNTRATREAVRRLAGSETADWVVYPGREEEGPPAPVGTAAAVRLLSVGNLIPRKGIATVLGALRRLAGRGELPAEFVYRIAGDERADPEFAGRLRRLARRGELAGLVEFAGRLSDEELTREFASASLFCLPSAHEGFGIVYLEAMSAGLPVIATRSGGAKELVRHGADGFLVEPGRPGALAKLLRRLLADPELRSATGKAARAAWERWPTWRESMSAGAVLLEEFVTERVSLRGERL